MQIILQLLIFDTFVRFICVRVFVLVSFHFFIPL